MPFSTCQTPSIIRNETERFALLSFKSLIREDPTNALATWNESLHFCQWQGVRCGGRMHPERVVSLNLSSLGLAGPISPSLSNLTFLRELFLQNNRLEGIIPQQLGRLFRLQRLKLDYNSLEGEIPANISHCSSLADLDLQHNMLVGEIPPALGTLSILTQLNLARNNITGSIPRVLGNLSSLVALDLAVNSLEGEIPVEICSLLPKLKLFDVESNRLSGSIPPSLFNLTALEALGLSSNQFVGTLPRDFGLNIPNLRLLAMFENQLEGDIPLSIVNASKLVSIDFGSNRFSGLIPGNLGTLADLESVQLSDNVLEAGDWSFLDSMTNCSELVILEIAMNKLKGTLPDTIGNLSTKLQKLHLFQNKISGMIPSSIGKLARLDELGLFVNDFTGPIPESLGLLTRLEKFSLVVNNLTGDIPSSLGNITNLYVLHLSQNFLTGGIPRSFQGFQKMQDLNLSFNSLSGIIPKKLVGYPPLLTGLDLSHNNLVGPLPSQFSEMENLNILDVSNNKLEGHIPAFIGSMRVLEKLHMENNLFGGEIPTTLSKMNGLQVLDLSNNNLSGAIPTFTSNSRLLLNLSFNNFEGPVPTDGVFRNSSSFWIANNKGLCGGIPELHLPQCGSNLLENSTRHKSMSPNKLKSIIIVVCACTTALVGIGLIFLLARKKNLNSAHTMEYRDGKHFRVSYGELLKATNDFSQENLIGIGSFGSVYKATLRQDENVVAVKVLNLEIREASKSFMAEVNSLKNIRHRNLVKILTSCSGVDYKGNEFKAIVFEFMKNGSLDDWLHPRVDAQNSERETRKLSISQRVNISIDIACAIEYLHLRCHKPITHCDLKPSNILLDDDLVAHVSDFGLARFLIRNSSQEIEASMTSTIGIKGTIGYIAPEYGAGARISKEGDIYSYGILLLEMFTGRRPTSDIFHNGLNLRQFVETRLPESVADIVDPELLVVENPNSYEGVKKCLVSIIKVGLSCSRQDPRERMEICNVITEICSIKGRLTELGTL